MFLTQHPSILTFFKTIGQYCCCLVAKSCLTLFENPWTVAHQALLPIGFPSQEYWSGMPFPSPGDISDPEIKGKLPHWLNPRTTVNNNKSWPLFKAFYRSKKDLNDPDNHSGVITHLEPDILECEVKQALGSITTNKASGVMEFQLRYFKS